MNVVFRAPDLDGDCVFAPWLYARVELPSGDPLVFRAPMHANGGCIFADPSEIQILEQRSKGGGGDTDVWRSLRDDEDEILAVILAVAQRRGYGGLFGVSDE